MRKNTSYTKFFLVFFIALTCLLVFNILFLAGTGRHLMSGDDIAYYASDVRSETVKTIKSERGNIYSFNGDLIATDRVAYNVTAYLDESRPGYENQVTYVDKPDLTAEVLSHYMTGFTKAEILETLLSENLYQYTFKANLSSVQLANLEEEIKKNEIHGLEFSKTTSRNYQYKHFSSYIIGLVNVNDDDPDHVKRNGAFGLEAAYDDVLNGKDGEMVYQADVDGRAIFNHRISEVDAVNGSDIYLSLDSEIQNILEVQLDNAMAKLGADKMWCGVMDAHTGRMLGMASRPDFDLQDRSTLDLYQDLFLNYTYEVGSVVKPFVYLTAMETGVYDGQELYSSDPTYVKGVESMGAIRDWNYSGWGMIPYDEGLIHSSNTAITHLVQDKMNFEDIETTFAKLGFFQDNFVDGLDAIGGWASYKDTDNPYDKVTMCFGQSATYTGYEILRAFSLFANDGKIVEPYLVDHIIDPDGQTIYSATPKYTEQIFKKEHVDHIRGLLREVVNNWELGTGNSYKMDDIEIFGKTGTGEIWDGDIGAYSKSKTWYSFVGGAPADHPEVIIFIGLEGSAYASNANGLAEVVHTVLPQALMKVNAQNSVSTETKVTDFTIGSFVNQSVSYAKSRLNAEGVNYVVIGDGDVVIKQTPEYNTNVSTAGTVYLLSDATNYYLPDFEDWSRKDIASYMQLLNIPVNFEGTGNAVSQSVESGTDISEITELTITLSE